MEFIKTLFKLLWIVFLVIIIMIGLFAVLMLPFSIVEKTNNGVWFGLFLIIFPLLLSIIAYIESKQK